ncbi:MAG: tryptophan--tRNA ligase [Candidatus Thermoplasmatota archaeon]|nr:tryptophan--tRNA ligase [Candidatus Thermoplasmatota archaeon]
MQEKDRSEDEFTVTPWEVEGDIDYEKLIEKFGTESVDEELLDRIEDVVGETHFMLRRGIFYSHRDLDRILDEYEDGNRFALYTGRGPSGHTHVGHLMPWIFAKWMQDKFDVELYFQLTDDEKFLFNFDSTLEETHSYALENAKDIIALGFDPEKTHIFIDTDFIHELYPLALKVGKRLNFSNVKAVFGFDNSTNVGSIFYTAIQSAPCFLPSELEDEDIPVLIPCGIDQDPHFRLTRDIAETIGYLKPALLHNKLAPSLDGSGKMSASRPKTTIFTTDEGEDVDRKINEAFTGGRVSAEEQRKKGGDPDICAIQNYRYFIFEEDDEKVSDLAERCKEGDILCGECKQILKENLKEFLSKHQKRRKEAEEKLDQFLMSGYED